MMRWAAPSARMGISAIRSWWASSSPIASTSASLALASTSLAATWPCGPICPSPPLRVGWARCSMRFARISFGMGRVNDAPVKHANFNDTEAWRAADATGLLSTARKQLGTVGTGKHSVDLFHELQSGVAPAASPVWIGIHFGSRGLGHELAAAYPKRGGGREGIDVPPILFHQDSARAWLPGDDEPRRALCLCWPRLGGGNRAGHIGRRPDRRRAQPPQFRLARGGGGGAGLPAPDGRAAWQA
jgi:hypothetical protein